MVFDVAGLEGVAAEAYDGCWGGGRFTVSGAKDLWQILNVSCDSEMELAKEKALSTSFVILVVMRYSNFEM